ncbi:hypothetical protein [Pseudopelagicola sp. nBUS_19]|uniref:hypothetical protein n=1 Tax=Pseudopelagicola sp. nBUS_19 TaxID=3395316 RepID=UPI003EB8330A
MTRPILAALIAAVSLSLSAGFADADELLRACNGSDRQAATKSMCNCIQMVANKSLNNSEQKLAASFFEQPHKAQEIRQSDRSNHETFWLRYKEFGTAVEDSCSHLR